MPIRAGSPTVRRGGPAHRSGNHRDSPGIGQNGGVTLAARVFAASHLTGTFVLRSGRTADHYFDKYRFESDPGLLADIVGALVPLLPPGVDGLRGSLCIDCAMLDRPNVSANWSLGNTNLCRGHLRFRLAHAQIDGGGQYHPV